MYSTTIMFFTIVFHVLCGAHNDTKQYSDYLFRGWITDYKTEDVWH